MQLAEQSEQREQFEQPEQSEQSEQYEQFEQFEQREQYKQSEQSEQREQREQPEQPEQSEQPEQLVQFSQFAKLSSAFCAASFVPKYSTEHLFPLVSLSHVVMLSFSPHSILRPSPSAANFVLALVLTIINRVVGRAVVLTVDVAGAIIFFVEHLFVFERTKSAQRLSPAMAQIVDAEFSLFRGRA